MLEIHKFNIRQIGEINRFRKTPRIPLILAIMVCALKLRMLRNRVTFSAHEDDKRSAAMTKSHWDYYGNLKPMMLFLTWTGLFSPLHNPHASTYLKIVTTASCILRLSVNIIILGSLDLHCLFMERKK